MKAKVVIENGETTIVLTPENVFEADVIESVCDKREKYSLETSVESQYSFGYTNHRIEIKIREERP